MLGGKIQREIFEALNKKYSSSNRSKTGNTVWLYDRTEPVKSLDELPKDGVRSGYELLIIRGDKVHYLEPDWGNNTLVPTSAKVARDISGVDYQGNAMESPLSTISFGNMSHYSGQPPFPLNGGGFVISEDDVKNGNVYVLKKKRVTQRKQLSLKLK